MNIRRLIAAIAIGLCVSGGAQAHDVNAKVELVGSKWEMAVDQYGNMSATADGTQFQINMDSIHIVDGSTRTATISEADSHPRLRADGSYTQQMKFKSIVVKCTGDGYSHPFQTTGVVIADTTKKPVKVIQNSFWGFNEDTMKEAPYGTVQFIIAEKVCAQ